MTESIQALADLVEQFPSRVRIDYDDNDDRRFCNNVLLALKKAWPDLVNLTGITTPVQTPASAPLPNTVLPPTLVLDSGKRTPDQSPDMAQSGYQEVAEADNAKAMGRISDMIGMNDISAVAPAVEPKAVAAEQAVEPAPETPAKHIYANRRKAARQPAIRKAVLP